jgi:hypothetical protein
MENSWGRTWPQGGDRRKIAPQCISAATNCMVADRSIDGSDEQFWLRAGDVVQATVVEGESQRNVPMRMGK